MDLNFVKSVTETKRAGARGIREIDRLTGAASARQKTLGQGFPTGSSRTLRNVTQQFRG